MLAGRYYWNSGIFLWTARTLARAIRELQPQLVIIENTRGLLSAPAHSDVEPCPWCLGDPEDEPHLRALGAVLGDLAELRLDAEWIGLPASDVGAPHERWREFVLAWPADTPRPRLEDQREGRPGRGPAASADADYLGGNGPGSCGAGRHEPADDDLSAAHAAGHGRREGGAEPARLGGRSDTAVGGAPAWGAYEGAIRRWEHVLGRPAPRPVDDRGRLAPDLPEWMMGYPAGHITAVPPAPGMTPSQLRNARLKATGNGVVIQQGAAAIRLLLARTPELTPWTTIHPTPRDPR